MNRAEAAAVLDKHLSEFISRPYRELAAIVDKSQGAHAEGPSGAAYRIEFNVVYDAGGKRELRVIGSIDDGGWRTFMFPLTQTEIVKPPSATPSSMRLGNPEGPGMFESYGCWLTMLVVCLIVLALLVILIIAQVMEHFGG